MSINYTELAAEFNTNIDIYAADIVAVMNKYNTDYYTAWQAVSNRLYRSSRVFAHITGDQMDRLDAAVSALVGYDVAAQTTDDDVAADTDENDVEIEIIDEDSGEGFEVESL